jgi:hypothetical protein
VRIGEAHDAVDARRQALNYAFAIKAGLGVEMSVGKRMLAIFERRPGLFHAALTGFRPAWNAFREITQGKTSLAELMRSHPMAQRALTALDRRPVEGGAVDADGEAGAVGEAGAAGGTGAAGGSGAVGEGGSS